MKRITIFLIMFCAMTQYLWADISVQTRVFNSDSQPPIVGGMINNSEDGTIAKTGVLVSLNINDFIVNMQSPFSTPYYEDNNKIAPSDYRVVDCSNMGVTQFWCPLVALKPGKKYYIKAYAIKTDGSVIYGQTESLDSQNFTRYNNNTDFANVWHAFDYTLFDLVTDELIDPNDGFYYSTNENPRTLKHTRGTSYNTCYKFATEWNYKLWYYHSIHCDEQKIVNSPIMSYNDGKLTITQNPLDANKNITLYYSINGNFFRPETYTDKYSTPIEITEPCYVCCYAISSDGYVSYTNLFVIDDSMYNPLPNVNVEKWFVVKIRTDKYLKASVGDDKIYASAENTPTINDDYLWGFIENADGTYTIVNKSYGMDYAVCTESGTREGDYVKMLPYSNAEHFVRTATREGFYFKPSSQTSGTTVYLNDCWCNGIIRYNYSTDDGSVLRLIDSENIQFITKQPTIEDLSIEVTNSQNAQFQWYRCENVTMQENWVSTNTGESNSSSSQTYTIDGHAGQIVSFDYSVSSESNYDKLTVTKDGETIIETSGTKFGSYSYSFTDNSTATFIATYSKDGSVDKNEDRATISNFYLSNAPTQINYATSNNLSLKDITVPGLYYCSVSYSNSEVVLESNKILIEAQNDNGLYFDNCKTTAGGSLNLVIKMKNDFDVTGYQFDLFLPNGISVATDSEGFPLASLSTDRTSTTRTNYFDASFQQNGALRILCNSTRGYAFSGNDGAVATISLKFDDNIPEGTYTILLKNITLTDATGTKSENINEFKGLIQVENIKLGDANGDGLVNVSDFSSIAAHILGHTPAGFVAKAADVNKDNVINVSDLSGVANIILHQTASHAKANKVNTNINEYDNTLYVNTFSANVGEQVKLHINMKNDYEVTGFQCDVKLPTGITIAEEYGYPLAELSTARTTTRKTNFFDCSYQNDGTLRLLCNSTSGYAFNGTDGEVAIITLNISNNANYGDNEIVLKNIVMTDATGTNQKTVSSVSSTIIVGNTNQISSLPLKADHAQQVFSANGQLLSTMRNGINIIRMSNGTVKKFYK